MVAGVRPRSNPNPNTNGFKADPGWRGLTTMST
jgi:hypothetical protein